VQEQWVRDEAQQRIEALNTLENAQGNQITNTPDEINIGN
jgi:hypothetical protein